MQSIVIMSNFGIMPISFSIVVGP